MREPPVTMGPTLAIFQQVVPHYRVGVFERLGKRLDGAVTLYAETFAAPVRGLNTAKTSSIGIGRTRFHARPLWGLIRGRHTTIICEGRLGLITSTVMALFGAWGGIRVFWWTPLWRPAGKIEVGRGPRGWFQSLVLRQSTGVIAYSTCAGEAARRAGVPSDRIHVARNSLDTHALEAAERRWLGQVKEFNAFRKQTGLDGCRIALFVGQIIQRKRLDALIEAFALLVSTRNAADLRLAIVGGGPLIEKYKRLTHSRGIARFVHFAGEVTDVEKACPYFLSSRVVVLPGAGGLVVNQALTHGVPVIVGSGGGDGTERDAITEGKNGVYWDGKSTGHLARQMERFLFASEERWAVWSRQARDSIRDRVNVEIMLDGIQRAVNGGEV